MNGRVYYNINNWYRGLLVLPSFGTNKEDVERMMGLQDEVDFVSGTKYSFAEKLQQPPSTKNSLDATRQLQILNVEEFLSNFERVSQHLGRSSLRFTNGFKCAVIWKKMSKVDGPHQILNSFVMMMNGRVYRVPKSGVDKPGVLQNNLMAGEEGIESTEPTKFLLRL